MARAATGSAHHQPKAAKQDEPGQGRGGQRGAEDGLGGVGQDELVAQRGAGVPLTPPQ